MSDYVDVYLRFLSERQFKSELPFFSEEEPSVDLSDVAVDIIGPIILTNATFDEEGMEQTPAVIDDRFHVNIRATQAFIDEHIPERFLEDPATPRRTWA